MKQPTQGQIKEFWEWCGVKYKPDHDVFRVTLPDGESYNFGHNWVMDEIEPPIDLNNLFKYAVPFLLEKHTIVETYSFKQENGLYYSETEVWDGDERQLKGKLVSKAFAQDFSLEKVNALALFWALWQIKEAK